jgi:hypothetical protein
MGLRHVAVVTIAVGLGLALPAHAQNYQGTTTYVPMYNTTTATGTPSYYAPSTTGAIPVYNNLSSTPPQPVQQYVAGKNAPSYPNPNTQVQPYNFQNPNSLYGNQTEAEHQATIYQQQLLAQGLQQQQQQQAAYGQQPYTNAYNNYGLTGGPFGNTPDSQLPKRRRVLYKELNNPLKEPTRLFNPDQ